MNYNEMTDEEYIRKAVEVADGWQYCDKGQYENQDGLLFDFDMQVFLDALAAQLVRQVDALNTGHTVCVDRDGVDVEIDNGGLLPKLLLRISGPDRTMNAIKAIVRSGVLSK